MAETALSAIQALKSLPEGCHWFCPKTSEDDYEKYFDEDLSAGDLQNEEVEARKRRKEKLAEAEERKMLVLNALQIFAFDGEEAKPFQEFVQSKLEHFMLNCDVCVRVFHASRSQLKESLEAEYDTHEVIAFMDKFDGLNVQRITKGLHHAERQLLHLPPEKRRVSALDPVGLFSLFEAMNCEPYLRSEQFMQENFDQPFQLVQTTKKLRLSNYLPAFTYFMFSNNEARHSWALHTWKKLDRSPTALEFDTTVRKALQIAMLRVQLSALEVQFLPSFWFGTNVIVSKLRSDILRDSLRPMDPNLYRLALDMFHLKEIDVPTFSDLVSTWKNLIEKSPDSFWDSMRSIAPQAIIEQVFRSPAMHQFLTRPQDAGMPNFEDVFAWIRPFLDSIKTNQATACAALLREFISRSQNDELDSVARSYCFTLALHVLSQTLQGMNAAKTPDVFVGSAVAIEMLNQVSDNLDLILMPTRGVKNGATLSEDATMALSLIQNAVSLDCLTLVMDRKVIESLKPRGHTAPRRSERFWDALTRRTTSNDQALATRVLLGARHLVSLEKFGNKFSPRAPEDPKQFAEAYDAKCILLSNFLEKLSDFPPFQLAGFFKSAETASSIVHILFSSDLSVRQGAVELLKTMSELTDRREAITYVLDAAFFSFLSAFKQSVEDICAGIIFSPMSGMLRLCTDVVEALCNPSSGILRNKSLVEEELGVVKELWQGFWSMLTTIFDNMEFWGLAGHDKNSMMDFCRDTMEFADSLFDRYSVFVNAIKDDYEDETENREQAKKLLRHPRDSMNSMVRWLRLRDEYLVEKIVGLVTSLLARLRKSKVDASDTTLDFIEQVSNGIVKTNLNGAQRAQLLDAMEKYSNRRASRPAKDEKKNLGKQTSISTWATSRRSKEDAISLDSDPDVAQGKVIADATKGADKFKKLQEQKKLVMVKKVPDPKRNVLDANEFIRKRKAAEEEAKRKRAAAVAAARGQMAGAGSALNSLGVATKDHSLKGQSVMVDSDSESESSTDDDPDDLDRELFGSPAKPKKQPTNAMSAAAAAALLPKGPVKIRRIQRSAKDMRARLAPDLSRLHQEVLSWNYFHDGYYPPNSRSEVYSRVPNSMQDPGTYKTTFQPLLVLETWRKICNDKDQESLVRPYEIKVINRSTVDAFIEVNTSISHDEKKVEVSEGDLVLLSNARDPRTAPDSPSCLGRIHKVARKKQHLEVLYRVMPGNKFLGSLHGGSTVHAVKIESLVTVEREYGALMGLQYYDLCDYILNAAPSSILKYSDQQLRPLMENYQLNQAQAKAVKSALDNDAFTLIQGPPGSGKTKTIVATVGALLTDVLRRDQGGTAINRPGMLNGATQPTGNTMKKLLVCAPSNAAVDELVLRFRKGIKMANGQEKKINVVRLGRSEKINPQVKEVTLEDLVAARLNKVGGGSEEQRAHTHKLMQEHKDISQKLNEAHTRRESDEGKGPKAAEIQDEIDALRRQKSKLSSLIDQAKDKESNMNRQNDLERKRVEQQVLDEAHVLCATLSSSGHDRFQKMSLEFETVIVDEAAQCTELQALIPLKYGCAKCILVGDPKQLPPTTFMDQKLNFQYEQSLFVRMQNNQPDDVHLLDTQYRMHPEISAFPSKRFYDGRLLDGPDMTKLREKPWHKDALLGPYRFFDVQGQQISRGSSLTNKMEINAAIQLFDRLMDVCPHYDFRGKLGIITPYKAQFRALKEQFEITYGKSINDTIEFNTTDAFQGRECEIIIFSCVRASEGSIGFLNDYRRMNVGLTRAKCSMWVLGNTKALVNGRDWRAMIDDAQLRGRVSPAVEITGGSNSSTKGKYHPTPITKLDYGDDSKMGGYPGDGSSDNSRRSSMSSFSINGKEKMHMVKREERVEDVDMKDSFQGESDDKAARGSMEIEHRLKKEVKGKTMSATIKREQSTPPPGVALASPGYSGARLPNQVPLKRRKTSANPLLDNKRPKKSKS